MNKFLMLLAACAISYSAFAQNNFTIIIKDSRSGDPLTGAADSIRSGYILTEQ